MLCYIINLTAYDWNLDLIFFPAVFSSLPLFLENKNLLKILGEVGSYEGVLKWKLQPNRFLNFKFFVGTVSPDNKLTVTIKNRIQLSLGKDH